MFQLLLTCERPSTGDGQEWQKVQNEQVSQCLSMIKIPEPIDLKVRYEYRCSHRPAIMRDRRFMLPSLGN